MARPTAAPHAIVAMTGPDERMDEAGPRRQPANPLPIRCPHCTFPDLDNVAEPYLLAKRIAAPVETAPAAVGNFLIRERARRILEFVVPGACTFHPTAESKSGKPTPWSLAVPNVVLPMPGLKLRDPQRCSKCKEPKLGFAFYDNGRFVGLDKADVTGLDAFKSREWSAQRTSEDEAESVARARRTPASDPKLWAEYGLAPPPHAQRWTRVSLSRDLFFSARLDVLFKQAAVKGQLVRAYDFKGATLSPDDERWVRERLDLLAAEGLVDAPKSAAGKAKPKTDPWFATYLKRNAKKKPAMTDFAAIEQRQKLTLPKSYRDFLSAVGTVTFEDVNDDGLSVKLLPPAKLDVRSYRRAKLKSLGLEGADVDGVVFAEADNGDPFLFDISAAAPEFPVYRHDHEQNDLEPYAGSFAACVRRFVEGR